MSIRLKDESGGLRTKVITFATAVALSGVAAFVPYVALADHSTAHTIEQLQAQIAALTAQLAALSAGAAPAAGACSFTRDLTDGVSGADVQCLQRYLNSAGFQVASSGAGSPGNETQFYGPLTRSAVARWQSGNAVSPAVGYFGPISRTKYNAVAGAAPGVPGAAVPVGSGLTVNPPPDMPPQTLAPQKAANVPFVKAVFTASSDGDVTVKSVTVERQGLSDDAVFDSIVLLDERGVQVGNTRTLGSDHRVTLNEPFVVKAGTSRNMTVGGNMASSLSSQAGQVAVLAIVGADAGTSPVNANLPIRGNGMVINATLAIGSVTLAKGPRDPSVNQLKEVGIKDIIFSSIRVTAGSAEDVQVVSVRWNQSGSAANSDFANLKTYVENTPYDVTVSSDGKYYASFFGSSELIKKGESKEIYVKGDVVGGSGREVDLDIFRRTDLVVYGVTYKYNLLPPDGSDNSGTDDSAFHLGTLPWYDASRVDVQKGSLRVESSPAVPAGNVAEGTATQGLAAFKLIAKGEAAQVTKFVFDVDIGGSGNGSTSDLTSVALYDQNGVVVAGPVDGVDGTAPDGTLTYTNTFTVPVGETTYTLKGKVGTDFDDTRTIIIKTNPDVDITAQGEVTAQTITATPTLVTANTQTVKSGAFVLSVGSSPVAQNVVKGVNGFTFATYNIDAANSGEDLRFTSLALEITTAASGDPDDVDACAVYDGATQLTTGGNVKDPTGATGANDVSFVLDNSLVVTKGTTKVVTLNCNISTNASSGHTYQWDVDDTASDNSATGVSSGSSFNSTLGSDAGPVMTVKNQGTFTVAVDASDPVYRGVAAGTTNNVVSILKLKANDEAINITQVGLQLSNTASNSPADLVKATLWDGATLIGEAIFTTDFATTSVSSFLIPKDTSKLLTIKADLTEVGTALPGSTGALVNIGYDASAIESSIGTSTRGIGQSSGQTIGADTLTDQTGNGFRMFNSIPTLTHSSVSGTLVNGTVDLLTLTATADAKGDVQLQKLTFSIATSGTAKVTSPSFNGPNGSIGATALDFTGTPTKITATFDSGTNTADKTIAAGTSKTFTLRGTVTGAAAGDAVSTALMADTSFATNVAGLMGNRSLSANNLWSPNSTTTAGANDNDWAGSYGLPGCFSGLGQDCPTRVLAK